MARRRRAPVRRHLQRAVIRALRRSFPRLGRLSPFFSSLLAELLFRTPPRSPRLRREERALFSGRYSKTPFRSGSLPTWTWGKGPAVLLVHGWGGHAGRLTPFVGPLTDAGFSVVAFDAPGHGSAAGRRSSLPEMVEAIRAVAATAGPFHAVVGHSLGATACALAIKSGLPVSCVVLLAPAADLEKYSGRFARILHIPAPVRDSMKKRLERRYNITWTDLRISGRLLAGGVSLLVFHDRGDVRVPLRDGLEVVASWPKAELVRTRGLGHHRILRDPKVIARAVAFLGGSTAVRPASPSVRRRPVRLRPVIVS
ncbi:MAG TPA: alpha/beta fold hydrolase [Thermoanaerobaculia bacterium]